MVEPVHIHDFRGETSKPADTVGGGGNDGGNMHGERITRLEVLQEGIREDFADMKQSLQDIRADSRQFKYWLVGTALTLLLGIIAGNYTIVQTTIAAIDAGRETARVQQPSSQPIIITIPSQQPASPTTK